MAFPQVVGSPVDTLAFASSTFTMNLPAGLVPANLLIAWISSDPDPSPTMSGWTRVGYNTGPSGTKTTSVWAKISNGSDTASLSGANIARISHCYQVSGASALLSDIGVTFTTTTASLNPPNLVMPAAEDILWFASARNDSDVTSAPANFTNLFESNFLGASWLDTARRQLNASSLDPGAFGGTVNNGHTSTVGIRPARPGNFLPFFS